MNILKLNGVPSEDNPYVSFASVSQNMSCLPADMADRLVMGVSQEMGSCSRDWPTSWIFYGS